MKEGGRKERGKGGRKERGEWKEDGGRKKGERREGRMRKKEKKERKEGVHLKIERWRGMKREQAG